jgi:hypothetical protein
MCSNKKEVAAMRENLLEYVEHQLDARQLGDALNYLLFHTESGIIDADFINGPVYEIWALYHAKTELDRAME